LGNNIPDPKIVPIPEFEDPKDFIFGLDCGKRNSILISNKGEVWITGNY
jgi:alpha-tubulin suppressor-like RCC1 family protein